MKAITIRSVRIEELSFINKVEQNGLKMSIQNKYSYNVRHAQNQVGRGEFTVEVVNSDAPEIFSIKLVLVGIFAYSGDISKEEIHRASYDELFPYVRAAVTSVTATAGIPPIYIPYVDISGQSIYRIELPHKD